MASLVPPKLMGGPCLHGVCRVSNRERVQRSDGLPRGNRLARLDVLRTNLGADAELQRELLSLSRLLHCGSDAVG